MAGPGKSPLFGGSGGVPFDDATTSILPTIVGLKSLAILHGPFHGVRSIISIQATYLQADGTEIVAPRHGGDGAGTVSTIDFAAGEKIVKISGTTGEVVTSLEITTRNADGVTKTYGPYGSDEPGPPDFTLVGDINGFFGRGGDALDAIGVHTLNPLDPQAWTVSEYYTPTANFGGSGGEPFDDWSCCQPKSGSPDAVVRIRSLQMQYGYSIGSLQVTYQLASGLSYTTPQHGRAQVVTNAVTVSFNQDIGEKIVQVAGKVGPADTGYVDMLTFVTRDSFGLERTYGPFGEGHSGPPDFVINGPVYGFFGRSGGMVDAIGFYV